MGWGSEQGQTWCQELHVMNQFLRASLGTLLRRIEHGVGVGSSMGNDCFLILEIMTVLVLFQSCSRTVIPDICFI